MNSAIPDKEFVLSLYHKLQDLKMQYQQTERGTQSFNQSIDQSISQSINQSFYMNNVTSLCDETISRYLFYEEVL